MTTTTKKVNATVRLPEEEVAVLEDIATACGLPRQAVMRIAIRRLASVPPTLEEIALFVRRDAQDRDPTPEEIAAGCEAIQGEWSDLEQQARKLGIAGSRGGEIKRNQFGAWTPPQVKSHVRH